MALTIAVLGRIGTQPAGLSGLAQLGPIVWCDDADSLIARVAAGGVAAVVAPFVDDGGRSIAPMIVAVAASQAAPPLVLYDRLNGATLPKLLAVFATGLRMTYAVRPYESVAGAVEMVTAPTFFPSVAPILLGRFVRRAPSGLAPFVALAALQSASRRGVGELASWLGISARTIERRHDRARWPTARTVLRSFAALDAVWLMSEYGWSARHVHEVRGFSHPSGVTRLLARYCGVRPATLREDGGFDAALDHVSTILLPDGPW